MKKSDYIGKFIVFDGLDGSGQSTQASLLASYLNEPKQKHKFGHSGTHLTKEPTSSLIGGLIRSQLNHDWRSSQMCLQLLFAADRTYHLEKEIIPLLEKGVTIVCDRYFFSSFAYGAIDSVATKWLIEINKNFLLPDLTFFIKVSPKICITRIAKERFGSTLFEKEEVLQKVWQNYEKLAKIFKNVFVINGERPVNKIHKEITKIIEEQLD